MNENTQKSVIQILTETLAEMSTRALNAEADKEKLLEELRTKVSKEDKSHE